MRFVLRLRVGKKVTQKDIKFYYMHFKKFGSHISSARMCLRMGQLLTPLKYCLTQIDQHLQGGKHAKVDLVGKTDGARCFFMKAMAVFSHFCDNYYFVGRIGVFDF